MGRNRAIGWLLLALLVLGAFACLMWAASGEEGADSPAGPTPPGASPAGRAPLDGG